MMEFELKREKLKPTGLQLKQETHGELAGPILPAEKKYIEKAIEQFELPPIPDSRALQRNVPCVEKLLDSARLLASHNDKVNARHLIRQCLVINPYLVEAIQLMIECLPNTECGRFEQSMLRKNLCKVLPSFYSYLQLAQSLYDRELWTEAAQAIEHAFQFSTEDGEHLFNANKLLGNIALKQGDVEAADEYYNKAFALNSQSSALLINIATLELQRGQLNLARLRFEEALRLTGESNNSEKTKCLIGLFLVSRELSKDQEISIDLLREVLMLEPNNRTAVHLFSLWAYQNGRHSEAIAMIDKYLESNSMDEEMSLIAAQFHSLLGNFEDARIEVEKAALLAPENHDALDLVCQLDSLAV